MDLNFYITSHPRRLFPRKIFLRGSLVVSQMRGQLYLEWDTWNPWFRSVSK